MKLTFTFCLLSYFLLLFPVDIQAQVLWDQNAGNPNDDLTSRRFMAVPGGYLNVGQGGSDGKGTRPDQIALVKSDLTGKVIWQKEQAFFGFRVLYPLGVAVTATGECYVGAEGFNPNQTLYPSQGLLVKYSPQGDTLWTRRSSQQGANAAFFRAVTTSDNGVVVIGYRGSDQFVEKYSANGQLLWHRTYFYSSAFPGFLQELAKRPDGFLVISAPNGPGLPPKYLMLDEEGQLVAEKPAVWDYPYSLTTDAAGNVLAAGARLVKISPQGDTLWSRRYTRYGRAFEARAVAPIGTSGYLVAGTISNSLNRLMVLLLLNSDGQVRRDTLLTSRSGIDVYPTGVILDANLNYVIGGYADPGTLGGSEGGVPNGPRNWSVQFTVALRNWERLLLTKTTSQLLVSGGYTLYPNPVGDGEQVRVLTPKGQPYQGAYEILSGSTGQLLRRGEVLPIGGQTPLLNGLPPGLYWLRLATDSPTERQSMLRLQKR